MNYINVDTGAYPISEADLRTLHPDISFGVPFQAPAPYKFVFPKPAPSVNGLTHTVVENSPTLTVKGHWEQDWNIVSLASDVALEKTKTIQAEKILAIKNVRDRLKEGGVKVGAEWFHSDVFSRIQWIGLMIMGANAPAIPWKTMTGSFVPLTPTLVQQVFAATGVMDANLFGIAEAKIQVMKAMTDPTLYDTQSGWPVTYTS